MKFSRVVGQSKSPIPANIIVNQDQMKSPSPGRPFHSQYKCKIIKCLYLPYQSKNFMFNCRAQSDRIK